MAESADAGYFAARGVDAVFRDISEIAITVATGKVRVYETVEGRDLADFGLVQAAGYPAPTATLLNAVAAYLDHRKVRGVNLNGIGAPTKLLHYVLLAQAGLQVPATRYVPVSLMQGVYPALARELGLPFVLKHLRGRKSDTLIISHTERAAKLSNANEKRDTFLAQEFIPGNITLRVFVFGGTTPVSVLRDSLSLSAEGKFSECVTLADAARADPGARLLAVRAAAVMKYDVASVDLVQH
jgi:glutathione synthase/RimK-type ligase-like ATP-grasp enzyme